MRALVLILAASAALGACGEKPAPQEPGRLAAEERPADDSRNARPDGPNYTGKTY